MMSVLYGPECSFSRTATHIAWLQLKEQISLPVCLWECLSISRHHDFPLFLAAYVSVSIEVQWQTCLVRT